jgi:hypothetical protein
MHNEHFSFQRFSFQLFAFSPSTLNSQPSTSFVFAASAPSASLPTNKSPDKTALPRLNDR